MIEHRNEKGELHRTDGPAVEYADGYRAWYLNGKLHRVDGPAIERANGSREWYLNGRLHRDDGPAIERPDGTRAWWVDGEFIRSEKPIPVSALDVNKERGDTTAKGARVAGLEGYTTSGLIEELGRREYPFGIDLIRELEITKSELEKARKQFMQEREHWLALRDDNTRLIRIVDELLKERGKVEDALRWAAPYVKDDPRVSKIVEAALKEKE